MIVSGARWSAGGLANLPPMTDETDVPDPGEGSLLDALDLGDEGLRPYVIALGAFAGAVAVATLVTLLCHPLGKKLARRHPVLAEVLNVGRR